MHLTTAQLIRIVRNHGMDDYRTTADGRLQAFVPATVLTTRGTVADASYWETVPTLPADLYAWLGY